jgi:shikimate kinase
MNNKSNIVLIGMPSCGKSVTGVVLAKILNKKFVDVDLMIQERAGKGLQAIINEDGIDAFKKLEEEVLLTVDFTNAVIATGGSAIYYDAAMEHLKINGTVVYIDVPIEDIKKRLKNIKTRGVAMGKGQTLDDLYNMRKPLYEKYADVTVDMSNFPPSAGIEQCIVALKRAGAIR